MLNYKSSVIILEGKNELYLLLFFVIATRDKHAETTGTELHTMPIGIACDNDQYRSKMLRDTLYRI